MGRETELVHFTKQYAQTHRILCIRVNNGGFRNMEGAYYRFTNMDGMSDFIGVHPKFPGRFFGLELKRAGENPTQLQAEFGRLLTEAGGIYGVCRTADEVVQFFQGEAK